MRKASLIKAGVAVLASTGIAVGLAAPASADVQAQANDVVIVGSDTAQYVADFLDDGQSAIAGTTGLTAGAGYNSTPPTNRVFNFDATSDAMGRTSSLNAGKASVVLRAGTAPVYRPAGSGDGFAAFENDSNHVINFVRSSRLPNSTEIGFFPTSGATQGLHTWRIASDGMQIAVSNTSSNAPTAGLTKAQLTAIYQQNPADNQWSDITTGASGDLIVPLLPPSGSGTHDDFLTDVLGSKSSPVSSNVITVQEHDPSPLTPAGFATLITANGGVDEHSTDTNGNEQYSYKGGTVTVADVISPFSVGRYNLIEKGYFDQAGSTTSGGITFKGALKLLPGTNGGTSGYFYQRYLYLTSRQSDYVSTTGWQPGSTVNWVKAIVGNGPGSWYGKSANAALFTDAGVTQAWKDCGVNPTSC